jgi:hypothetical protein
MKAALIFALTSLLALAAATALTLDILAATGLTQERDQGSYHDLDRQELEILIRHCGVGAAQHCEFRKGA